MTTAERSLEAEPGVVDGLAVATLSAVGTVAAYLAFLGWDQHRDIGPDGGQTGPYQAWQVLGLTAVLVGLAVWAARRGQGIAATLVISAVLTLAFSVTASRDPNNDGLWGVGATMLLVGSTLGLGLVSLLTTRWMRGVRA
jgi:GNAT superfamily N-acetyltransferase